MKLLCISVKIYKCDMMGDSCGRCLIIPSFYSCGWCDSKCSIQGDCIDSTWLHSSSTCPNPKILRVSYNNRIPIVIPYQYRTNHIDGVMVSMLTSSMVDCVLEPQRSQTKDYEIGICCIKKWVKTDLLWIRTMCLSGFCFSELALWKLTKRVGLE